VTNWLVKSVELECGFLKNIERFFAVIALQIQKEQFVSGKLQRI
jgi:hypothetical protein